MCIHVIIVHLCALLFPYNYKKRCVVAFKIKFITLTSSCKVSICSHKEVKSHAGDCSSVVFTLHYINIMFRNSGCNKTILHIKHQTKDKGNSLN